MLLEGIEGPFRPRCSTSQRYRRSSSRRTPTAAQLLAGLVTPSTAGPRVLSSPSVPSLPAAGSALCRQLSLSECDCPQGPALLVTITLGGGCGGGGSRERGPREGGGYPDSSSPSSAFSLPHPRTFKGRSKRDPTPHLSVRSLCTRAPTSNPTAVLLPAWGSPGCAEDDPAVLFLHISA